MINLDRFENLKSLVKTAFTNIGKKLSLDLEKNVILELEDNVDEQLLERMEQLEKEIFSIEDNVYNRSDILECLVEEDSLLLLLKVDGKIEGYVFGYDDDPDNPTVPGTDYFIDSALVSLQYEHKGVGAIVSGVVLIMLYLLGYRSIGILTEEKDKTGRELVSFYKRLGFKEVGYTKESGCAMKIELNQQFFEEACSRLGIVV